MSFPAKPLHASSCILFFIKAPKPGSVKSRLAQAIGQEHATQLYKNFVLDLLSLLQTLVYKTLIFYTPTDAENSIQTWLGKDFCYYPQVGEDLGERLENAFNKAFELGYQKVIVIGSDSPDLTSNILQTAFLALEDHDGVIGPTHDGGYYTIGFSKSGFFSDVFKDIIWSTDTVFETTLSILRQHQKTIYQLPCWYDVDTIDDLQDFYLKNYQLAPYSQTVKYLFQHQEQVFKSLINSDFLNRNE